MTSCVAMPLNVLDLPTDERECGIDSASISLTGSLSSKNETSIDGSTMNGNANDEHSIDAMSTSSSQTLLSVSFSSQPTPESHNDAVVENDTEEDCEISSASEKDGDSKNNETMKNHFKNDKNNKNENGLWKEVVKDFDPKRGGDFKILRAIGRTATVNAVVSVTALLGGPVAGVAGYATGGAITAKRLVGDGIVQEDKKEIAKSLAVFGGATSASLVGQAVSGAVMLGLLGASLPVAGAVAFSVGCVSGITAGALSEWGVDGIMDNDDNYDYDATQQKSKQWQQEDDVYYDDALKQKVRDHAPSELVQKTRVHKYLNDGAKSKEERRQQVSDADKKKEETVVDAVGAWFIRQQQRNRQRKMQREASKRTADDASRNGR